MTTLTSKELRELLERLDGESADDLESQHLEFKSADARGAKVRAQSRAIREAAVAFANAEGGTLVLGIGDGKRTRADAIIGVKRLDPRDIQRDIYDGTDPHITVDIEELHEPEGRMLVVRVPSSDHLHTTTDGVARIRVGKESKRLTGSNLAQVLASRRVTDSTVQIVPGCDLEVIDPKEINRMREIIRIEDVRPELNGLRDAELLEALGLAEGQRVNIAAILLLGHKSAVARYVPQHELTIARFREPTQYDFRKDIREPLLKTIDEVRQVVDSNVRLTTIEVAGFHHFEIPDMNWVVIREAVLNALVHRDYFLSGSIQVFLRPDHVEITSPGGFIGDVSPENVLRHRPVRRNHLLADALQAMGLVNRAGLGVDRIFEDTLRGGKDFPMYESDIGTVRLTIPTGTHIGFARFVADIELSGGRLELDDLMIMRNLMTREELNRRSAADVLGIAETDAAVRLASLNARGFLQVRGRGQGASYRLGSQFSDWDRIETPLVDHDLGPELASKLVLQTMSDRGSITNADVRTITGYQRNAAVALLRAMREEGLIEVRGRGRGAHYVLPE